MTYNIIYARLHWAAQSIVTLQKTAVMGNKVKSYQGTFVASAGDYSPEGQSQAEAQMFLWSNAMIRSLHAS